MTISEELLWRGQIKDHTFDNPAWLNTPRTFYLGVDCSSADSLTIGNLAVFMLARRLYKAGWKMVLLVGGATSLIGDPGGKDEERVLRSREDIAHNVAGIKRQVQQLFQGEDFELVDNYDWFKDIHVLDFLRDIGKHYSMTELVQRDFIAERMGKGAAGISYAEFSYTLIQGYDFWYLFKHYGVTLQIGGSDQWGNMLSGVPLIRKKEGKEAHALSMSLVINKTTGRKFGKSEAGAVWLDSHKTSPAEFYQFWVNVDDANVEDYLKIYTDLDERSVTQLMNAHQADPKLRLAQKKLALEVTELVHGVGGENLAGLTFAGTATSSAVLKVIENQSTADLDETELKEVRSALPHVMVKPNEPIAEALVTTKLASSKSEARTFLKSGAVYANGQQLHHDLFLAEDFISGRLVLRRGKTKSNSALIELAE